MTEADLGRLLDDGDNIVRVLTARKENIAETVAGLDVYTRTLADAIAPGTLPDGSRYGNMKIFIDLGELRSLICAVLGPSSPEADLAAVREALATSVPELSCPADGAAPPAGDGADGAPPATDAADVQREEPEEAPPTDPLADLLSTLATPDVAANDGTFGDVLAALLGGPR